MWNCLSHWGKCADDSFWEVAKSGFHYLMVQPTKCTCYLKLFILVKRSTCFGRSFSPSWGAQNRVYSNGIVQPTKCTLSQIIYSCKTLYMFRTFFQSITRSSKPCIQQRYSTTNKMHMLSQIIYSCKTLYMFRRFFQSIMRSSKLRIQQQYMSNSCCYLLLSGMRWNAVPSHPR